MKYAKNADGLPCFLHTDRKTCDCNWHCTGCRHSYAPHQPDCCTCCDPARRSE